MQLFPVSALPVFAAADGIASMVKIGDVRGEALESEALFSLQIANADGEADGVFPVEDGTSEAHFDSGGREPDLVDAPIMGTPGIPVPLSLSLSPDPMPDIGQVAAVPMTKGASPVLDLISRTNFPFAVELSLVTGPPPAPELAPDVADVRFIANVPASETDRPRPEPGVGVDTNDRPVEPATARMESGVSLRDVLKSTAVKPETVPVDLAWPVVGTAITDATTPAASEATADVSRVVQIPQEAAHARSAQETSLPASEHEGRMRAADVPRRQTDANLAAHRDALVLSTGPQEPSVLEYGTPENRGTVAVEAERFPIGRAVANAKMAQAESRSLVVMPGTIGRPDGRSADTVPEEVNAASTVPVKERTSVVVGPDRNSSRTITPARSIVAGTAGTITFEAGIASGQESSIVEPPERHMARARELSPLRETDRRNGLRSDVSQVPNEAEPPKPQRVSVANSSPEPHGTRPSALAPPTSPPAASGPVTALLDQTVIPTLAVDSVILNAAAAPDAALSLEGELSPVLASTGDAAWKGPDINTRMPSLARAASAQIIEAVRLPMDGFVEVRLSPEELGRVRLSIVPGDSGLLVQLVAERPETLELLRRHADQLATDLRGAGYSGLEFSFGREGDKKDAPVFEMRRETVPTPEIDTGHAEVRARTASVNTNGSLDIRL